MIADIIVGFVLITIIVGAAFGAYKLHKSGRCAGCMQCKRPSLVEIKDEDGKRI